LLILFMRFRPEGLIPEYFQLRRSGKREARAEIPYLSGTASTEATEMLREEPAPSGSILEVKGLSKSFGGIDAVNDFHMGLAEGMVTALVGPNGCGKSTVFNLITGFLKPDQGSISFRNSEITNLSAYKMPRIGIVRSWQDVRNFQGMTVLDNVLIADQDQSGESLIRLFLAPWRVRKEEKENLAKALLYLEKVGLVEKKSEIARNLSYAEQKLLAIARLLCTGAQVLLLDEPASGVDPNWVEQFMAMIRNLAESGKTICIVEHNLEVVRGVSDTVYFMAEGKKIAQGSAEELMADPKLAEIYFGV